VKAPASAAGRSGKCPKCGAIVSIPAETQRSRWTTADHTDTEHSPTSSPDWRALVSRDASEPDETETLISECLQCFAKHEELIERDDRRAAEAHLDAVLQRAAWLTASTNGATAGWVVRGLAFAHRGDFAGGAQCLMEAIRRDGAGLGHERLAGLIDYCARFYGIVTFLPPEQSDTLNPPGMQELVAALQKTLIMAGRDVPLPGARAQVLLNRLRDLQAAGAAASVPPSVQCPACLEDLKGYVARCPHCTTVLFWMNCPTCKDVVATRVSEKFVGEARGGYQLVHHCIRCGRKLAGPDCFIATAAYGSTHEPSVVLLRSFRDRVLMRSRLGRALVIGYYAVSPGLAARVRDSRSARRFVRFCLGPVVWAVRLVHDARPGRRDESTMACR
jgi:hypothetical protein